MRSRDRHGHQGSMLDRWLRGRRLKRVLPHVPARASLLDIGCGPHAGALRELAPLVSHGHGIDLDAKEEGLPSNIEVHRRAFQDVPWPIPPASCDAAIMLAVLEHVEPSDLDGLFENVRRVLKPGGRFFLTMPTPRAKPILEFLAYRLHLIDEESIRDHKVYYDETSLTELLRRYGFAPERLRRFQFGFNLECVARME